MREKISTDMIVGTGLVVALIIGVIKGISGDFLSCLATGLVGFLGKATVSGKPSEAAQGKAADALGNVAAVAGEAQKLAQVMETIKAKPKDNAKE